MKRLIRVAAALCALLLSVSALAEAPAAALVSCEYAIFGGMENESLTYTIRRDDSPSTVILTIAERGRFEAYALPVEALDDLAEYMAGCDPAGWSALPDREVFALDAPERRIVLIYDDGSEYVLDSDRETERPIFADTERLLGSYIDGAE